MTSIFDVKRLVKAGPGVKTSVFHITNIPRSPSNIMIVMPDGQAMIEKVSCGQKFHVPEVEVMNIVIGSSTDMDPQVYKDSKLMHVTMNTITHVENAIVYDIVNIRPDVNKTIQAEGITQYEIFKEQVLLEALNLTAIGMFVLLVTNHTSLLPPFGFGGLANQAYMFLLYKDIDNIGGQGAQGGLFFRLGVIVVLFAISHDGGDEIKDADFLAAFLMGILTGKVSLLLNSTKKS